MSQRCSRNIFNRSATTSFRRMTVAPHSTQHGDICRASSCVTSARPGRVRGRPQAA
jgi:hypothetical protein